MATQADKLVAWLTANGWVRDLQSTSLKYKVFVKRGEFKKFYVGPSGAFRMGRNLAESYPQDKLKAKILNPVDVEI
jgi:hypothetical protein